MIMQGNATSGALGRVRAFVSGFDKPVLLATFGLLAYGLVVIYSASLTIADASLPRQALGVLLGLVAMGVFYRYDYRRLRDMAKPLFVIDCILMILPIVPGLSYASHGMSGWIQIPGIGLTMQTAELGKPITILLMASLASRYGGTIDRLGDYLRLCAVLAVPFGLILLQPDLGTGLVILLSGAVVIVFAGPRRSWVIATLAIIAALVVGIVVNSLYGGSHALLQQYQVNRLLVFMNPSADTSGSGYNLQQSLIAVGSGGVLGKGIGNATQAGMGFLPEAHTDFVFALQAEEFGFVGSALLIGLFALLVIGTIRVAMRCESLFGQLVCVGIAVMWTFQTFENIGMCLSLMPITGIPLPFISYGSSSMVTQLLTVGLVHSVAAHQTKAG